MNEKEIGKALLRGEEEIDLQALTNRVLKRDRRRIWFLAILSLIAWMMVVMVPWATILPMMAKVGQYEAAIHSKPDTYVLPPHSAGSEQQDFERAAEVFRVGTIATFIDSIAAMFIAALLTVLLIVLSRRATLRQVNARLREISIQIKALADRPGA